ncbi:MAG: hypothetical protein PHC28_04860 [Flavobacterium sp.]|uniref:hypothetical protein n=1 Tax=Flavobacterium sp. TaxID=239 RepID=UPI00262241CA|nr:hypothetical protein [Flavobacterium sp.]MDD5149796.1 hypothetical protein [Flavobacterium sp.]
MQNTKIYRLGKRTPKETGVITIASSLHTDESGNYVTYQASFCSPKDRYDKQFGIRMAIERHNLAPIEVRIPIRKHNVVVNSILVDMLDRKIVPDWSRKTIRNFLARV